MQIPNVKKRYTKLNTKLHVNIFNWLKWMLSFAVILSYMSTCLWTNECSQATNVFMLFYFWWKTDFELVMSLKRWTKQIGMNFRHAKFLTFNPGYFNDFRAVSPGRYFWYMCRKYILFMVSYILMLFVWSKHKAETAEAMNC